MKLIAVFVFIFALLTAAVAYHADGNIMLILLSGVAVICAATTYLSNKISSFLKIFVGTFATELVIFGGLYIAAEVDLWPAGLDEYKLPESLPLTMAIFAILVYAVSFIPLLRRVMRIADRYYDTSDRNQTLIWPISSLVARERVVATTMLVLLVLINQAQVGINVRLNFFSRDWFNAIQAKNEPVFWFQLFSVFAPCAFTYIITRVIEYVVQATLMIKWRRWLTEFYTGHWLGNHAHYRMALAGNATDNPDQRISEDISRFIDGGQSSDYGLYTFTITLISQLSTLVSFAIILWNISANFTLPYTTIAVPGFLFWIALLYAGFGTIGTHLIGRPLARLAFERQKYEANFRFSLARMREYGEQIALLRGENAEHGSLTRRFGSIIKNYFQIVHVGKLLTAFQSFYAQISPFIPYVVSAPFYFAGKIALGIMTQTASAFGHVNSSLNFFVTYYTSLAEFKSVLERLQSFDEAIDRAQSAEVKQDTLQEVTRAGVTFEGVNLRLPNGRAIVESDGLQFAAKESVLLTGPSGSGKSTFLRAISGIWPYSKGKIDIPRGARLMLLPQHPYIPIGSLRAAITYPSSSDQYSDQSIRDALEAAELKGFVDQLDVEDVWSQRLSGGEQQRLALARVLLAKPDWLFLDEATSAMDEDMEYAMYKILHEKLQQTTLVSIGHRSTLERLHDRRLIMTPTGSGSYSPREFVKKAAE
jgi:vitamin B12/bleomycin/antimicrobial peptide transport system ATP-binding/permease protein